MFECCDDIQNLAHGGDEQEAIYASQPSITDQGRQPREVSVSNGTSTNAPDISYTKGTSKSAYSLSKCLENEFISIQKNLSAEEGTVLQRKPCYQFVDPWHTEVPRHDPMMDCSIFLRNDNYGISDTHTSSASQKQQWISKYSDALLSSALDFILSSHMTVPVQNLSKHRVYRPLPVYPVPIISQGRSESYSSVRHYPRYHSGISQIGSENQFFDEGGQAALPQPLNCQPVRRPSLCTQTVSCHPINCQSINSQSANCQTCNNPTDGCQPFCMQSTNSQPPNIQLDPGQPFIQPCIIQPDSCQPFIQPCSIQPGSFQPSYNQLVRSQRMHSQTVGCQPAKSHPVSYKPVNEEQRTTQQNKNSQYSFHSYDPKLKIQEPFMSFLIDKALTSESAFTMIHSVKNPETTKPFPHTHRRNHASSQKHAEHLSTQNGYTILKEMETQFHKESAEYTINDQNTPFEAANDKKEHVTMTTNSNDLKVENIFQKDKSLEDQEVELLTSKKISTSATDLGSEILSQITPKNLSCSTADNKDVSWTHLPVCDSKSESENTGAVIKKTKTFPNENISTNDKTLTQEGKSQEKMSPCYELVTERNAAVNEENSISHEKIEELNQWVTSILETSPYKKEKPGTDEVINISNEMWLAELIMEKKHWPNSEAMKESSFQENVENHTTGSDEDSSNCSDVIPYAGHLDHSSYCKPLAVQTSIMGSPMAVSVDTSETDIYDESPDKTLIHSPMSDFQHLENSNAQEVCSEYVKSENGNLQEVPFEGVDTLPKNNINAASQFVSINQKPASVDPSVLLKNSNKSDKLKSTNSGANTKVVDNVENETDSKKMSEQNLKMVPSSGKSCKDSTAGRSSFPIKPKLMMIKKYEESNLKNEDVSFCHNETERGHSLQPSENLQQCRNGKSSLFSDTAVQFVEKEYQMHLGKSFDGQQKPKRSKRHRFSEDAVKKKKMPSSQKRRKTVSQRCIESKSKKLKASYTVNNAETSFSSESDQQTLTCPEDLEHCEVFHWCHVCEKTVKTEEDSIRHVKLHGIGVNANLSYYYLQVYGCVTKHWRGYNKAEKCVYLCGLCEKTIPYIKGFKRHILRHGCGVFCSHCDRSFEDEETLKKHRKTHPEEKPYHCSECSRSYSTKGSFNMHRHSHHVTDTFECLFCGKVLSSKGSLTTHTRLHTGDNPYKCRLCDRSYPQNVQLKLHMKAHQRLGEI